MIGATTTRLPAGSAGAPSPVAATPSRPQGEFSSASYKMAHSSPLAPDRSPLGSVAGKTAEPNAAVNLERAPAF